MSLGNDTSTTVYIDHVSRGGDGSGGGAGLGGMFVGDTGANLTLHSRQVIYKVVKGGDGGALHRSLVEDMMLRVRKISISADQVSAAELTLDLDFTDGNLLIKGPTLANGNALIGKVTNINFIGVQTGGVMKDVGDPDHRMGWHRRRCRSISRWRMLRAKAEVGHGFSGSLRGFVKLRLDHDMNSDERRLTADIRINLADNILWTLEGHVDIAASFARAPASASLSDRIARKKEGPEINFPPLFIVAPKKKTGFYVSSRCAFISAKA